MTSNDDYSTDGQWLHHNTGNKGSMSTIRVGSRSLPVYPLVIVCLGLLNTILLLAAVVIGIYCGKVPEEYTPHQITAQDLFVEVKQLQIMQSEAVKAHEEAQRALEKQLSSQEKLQLQLEQNRTFTDSLERQTESLHVERAMLLSNGSNIRESCGRCLPGWFLLNTTCYFHGKLGSGPLKNWTQSREDCIHRGADLVVIDSLEEQVNLFEFLPKVEPRNRPWWNGLTGTWIGFTDIEKEGTWVWVNNVTQRDQRYWIQGEPNNHGAVGEHCAAIANRESPKATWYDANCKSPKEWLCEMVPN